MTNFPHVDALKAQAKALRQSLVTTGHIVSHAQSLELLAKQLGYRDWNTLRAASEKTSTIRVQIGQNITGYYLGHPFSGIIINVDNVGGKARIRLTVRFDTPVNVSKFDSMVVERRQVTATLNLDGQTTEKTSDGTPHMVLNLR